MSADATTRPRRVWRRWAVVGVLAAIAVGVTVGLVLFFSGDEPEQVDAERALQQDQEPTPTGEEVEEVDAEEIGDVAGGDVGELGEEPEEVGPPDEPDDLDGRWVVDHSRPFDREEGRGTFAGYRIREELAGVGNSVAVGRSPEVEGHVIFEGGAVTSAHVEVDLTALVSDDGRRDARVRSELGPDARASFDLETRIELPEVPPVGEVIELTVPGQLTIVGTTNDVDVQLQVVVTETGLLVAGSTVIELEAYDVEVPSATIVLSVDDEATIEWQLFLVRE
jgi:polyisoprenoid-binding protein YceI